MTLNFYNKLEKIIFEYKMDAIAPYRRYIQTAVNYN